MKLFFKKKREQGLDKSARQEREKSSAAEGRE
jgi:hypothetical protein